MNLRQLKYFVRVVEMQNMTRAAESLHVAQPALSQQMSLLEDNLGVALLVRGAKGVQPTAEGLLLYRHAQTILRQVDSTRSLLSRTADQVTGTVSIGLASSTARMLALPLMRRAKAELPSVVLEIVDVPSADLTKLVLQGRIDFSLSPDQQPMQGLQRTPLLRESLFLLAHASVALPRRTLGIADFAAGPAQPAQYAARAPGPRLPDGRPDLQSVCRGQHLCDPDPRRAQRDGRHDPALLGGAARDRGRIDRGARA